MKKMLLSIGLLMASLGSLSAMTLQEAQSKQFNLKHHEKQIAAYHAKMGEKASDALTSVVQGMKKNNYMYDLDTARTVLREVYAHRMPQAPKNIDR